MFLFSPLLARLRFDRIVDAAGYPGSKMVPACNALLSLLLLKLLDKERRSHIDDFNCDEDLGLWAGLAVKGLGREQPTLFLSNNAQRPSGARDRFVPGEPLGPRAMGFLGRPWGKFAQHEHHGCLFVLCELSWSDDRYKEWHQVRVISKARLKSFWETPGHEDSEGPLRAWYTHVNHRSVSRQSWGDVKADYGSASLVGNCIVFNIGGNKYRLATRVLYASQKVFVLKVMTHKQYDDGKWKEQGGCFQPPPARKARTEIQGRRRAR